METNLATDGETFTGWQTATSGQQIPGITSETDLSGAMLDVRASLSTSDASITPILSDLTVLLRTALSTNGHRVSPNIPVYRETRISWTANLNGQTLAMETSLSRNGGSAWEGWESVENGGMVSGTDTGNMSNAVMRIRESLATADLTITPQLNTVMVFEPVYRRGLWSKNGEILMVAPPVGAGIRVVDASGNEKVNIGQFATGDYGAKVTGGKIFSTSFRSGDENSTSYIEIRPGFEPLKLVKNNKDALVFFRTIIKLSCKSEILQLIKQEDILKLELVVFTEIA